MRKSRFITGLLLAGALIAPLASTATAQTTNDPDDPSVTPVEQEVKEAAEDLMDSSFPKEVIIGTTAFTPDGTKDIASDYGLSNGKDTLAWEGGTTVTVDSQDELDALVADSRIETVQENTVPFLQAQDINSRNDVGLNNTPANAYGGTNKTIAIIDSGFNPNTPGVSSGRVLYEACFNSTNTCDNGSTSETNVSGAADWDWCIVGGTPIPGCLHGTAVQQIALASIGSGSSGNLDGAASAANVMRIRAGQIRTTSCDGGAPQCTDFATSAIVAALSHIDSVRNNAAFSGSPIVAVNISLGGGNFTGTCDTGGSGIKAAVDSLRSHGISVVIASGNSGTSPGVGLRNGTSFPACVSTALSVSGNVSGTTNVAEFANLGATVDVFAPSDTSAEEVTGSPRAITGTSYAAPVVTGSLAVLAENNGGANVDQREWALKSAGNLMFDARTSCSCYAASKINVVDAIKHLDATIGFDTDQMIALKKPIRIVDSRGGWGIGAITQIGAGTFPFNAAQMLGVTPGGIKAILFNLTVIDANAAGAYMSLTPGTAGNSAVSNINNTPGMNPRAVQVWSGVDSNGFAGLYNSAGGSNFLIDIQGFIGGSANTGIQGLTRMMDTRDGTGGVPAAKVFGGNGVMIDPRGKAGVPNSSSVRAVIGNITVINGNYNGVFVTAGAAGISFPSTSNVNVPANVIRSNMAVIPLQTTGGNAGKIEFFNGAASTQVDIIFDVVGWITTAPSSSTISSLGPIRLLDSRPGPASGNTEATMVVPNFNLCPTGYNSALINVTLLSATNGAYMTVWDENSAMPSTSNVNAYAGYNEANLALVSVSDPAGPDDPALKRFIGTTGNNYLIDIQGCGNPI